jgi:hypothetical protein
MAQSFKGRLPLEAMVRKLEEQAKTKVDAVIDSRMLQVTPQLGEQDKPTGVLMLGGRPDAPQVREWMGAEALPIRDSALPQVGERANPVKPAMNTRWLRAMAADQPEITAELLTRLLGEKKRRRLVRMLDGTVRAFLDQQYRCIDHFDILPVLLKKLRECGGEVIEGGLSEKHMRIKCTTKAVWDAVADVRRNEDGNWYAGGLGVGLRQVAAKSWGPLPGGPGTIYPVVTFTNSETGHGRLNARVGILMGICFNIATVEEILAEVHLGSSMDAGIFSDETRKREAALIISQVNDTIDTAFETEPFRQLIARVKAACEETIYAPAPAVDHLVEFAGLSQEDRDSIFGSFVADYKPTVFGLAQAVTIHAQKVDCPDKCVELENLGGTIIKGEVPELTKVGTGTGWGPTVTEAVATGS